MKRVLVALVILSILWSCNKDEDSDSNVDLIGSWRLSEMLLDPGDGSGTFSEVQSNKRITFEAGGQISSNGNLCTMSINSDNQTSGTYSETESTFSSDDCNDPSYNYTFEHNGAVLIIHYPCIEPCLAKYIKE